MSYGENYGKTRGKNWPSTKLNHYKCTYDDVVMEIMARIPYHAQMAMAFSCGTGRGKINPRDIIVELA